MTNAEAIKAERKRVASLGGKARAKLPKHILTAAARKANKIRWDRERKRA